MDTKGKSENQKLNLDLVLETISDDLRANIETTTRFILSIEKLNGEIGALIENKKESGKDQDVILKEIRQGNSQVSRAIEKILSAESKLKQLADTMEKNSMESNSAGAPKIIHQHHVSKVIWVTAGLFLLLSLESAGWLNTVNKLDQFIENDTKYRFMRLDTAAKNLQSYLDSSDARYKSNPEMRKVVIEMEDEYRKNMERLEKAYQLKQEATELENKVHSK